MLRSTGSSGFADDDNGGSLVAASKRASPDRNSSARRHDPVSGDLLVKDLIDRRLLVGVHVAGRSVVINRPLSTRRIEAFVDRPDAGLGQGFPSVFDRL